MRHASRTAAVTGVIALLATSTSALAAEHYVRADASGAASGDSWTDAWNTLPDDLVRGDTYYVAAGDYDGYTFDDAEQDTLVTVVRKATSTDHGAAPDWQDAYGAAPATFPGLTLATSYWTLDGATGAGSDKASYGFAMRTDTSGADQTYVVISAGNVATFYGITIRHVAVECSGPDDNVGQVGLYNGTQATVFDAVVQHLYVDNCSNAITIIGSGWLIEHSYFGRAWSSAEHHGEQIDSWGTSAITFRHNVLAQCAGTTCIGNDSMDGWEIYGNVFADVETGNGVIGVGGTSSITNTLVYDNTVVRNGSTSFLYQNNPDLGSGSGNVVQNNLFYDSNGFMAENGGGAIEHGYNAFFACTEPDSAATDQLSDADPFVNLAGGDYHLALDTEPGATLGSPFDVDPDGLLRGQDGVWDRGAFERCSSGDCEPAEGGAGGQGASAGGGQGAGTTGGEAGAGAGAQGGGGAAASASNDGGSTDEGGCGCRVGARGAGLGLPAFVGLLLLGARRRRRDRLRGHHWRERSHANRP